MNSLRISSTITPQTAAIELLKRRKARKSLLDFCSYTMPSYEKPAHIVALAEKLEAVERGEIKRLMVLEPPRHGKSELISLRFPCWYLARHPLNYIVQTGYAESIALTHSRKARDIFVSLEMSRLFPQIRYRPEIPRQETEIPERQAAHEWGTKQGGSYFATGIGGGLTGRGFDIGIIDDPVKDAEEAYSITIRNKVWEWYRTVFYTRAAPEAAIIVVMTRWHFDDLAGRILEQDKDKWDVISLPALAEEDDPLGREEGEALWPERYDKDTLMEIAEAIGGVSGRNWVSLYQQRPVKEGGNIFKSQWWQTYRELPAIDLIGQYWDTAFKQGAKTDYSVCVTLGRHEKGICVLRIFRAKLEFPELLRQTIAEYNLMKPNILKVEDTASGTPLIQTLTRDTRLPILPIIPIGSKEIRANQITGIVEAGRVALPETAEWLAIFLEEMTTFPAGVHDDIVDAFVEGVADIWEYGKVPLPKEKTIIYDALEEFGQIAPDPEDSLR